MRTEITSRFVYIWGDVTMRGFFKTNDKTEQQLSKDVEINKGKVPAMDNFPNGFINWEEISHFIIYMLDPLQCKKGWGALEDEGLTEQLSENSIVILKMLKSDLYDFFYQHPVALERFEHWRKMEEYIRTKYHMISEKALDRVIGRYHIDDR